MITLDEALERVLENVSPLPAEQTALLQAVGRVLAEEVVARRDLPPENNSAMDGYALRGEDAVRPGTLSVVETVAAGDRARREVQPGEAARIMTGAPIPAGADTVVPQERTRAGEGTVEILEPHPRGANVRPRGDDVCVGEVVVPRGTVVGPAEVGALASKGRTLVRVHRRPRVAVLASGNELVEPDGDPSGGRIVNSNNPQVAAACLEAGAEPVVLGTAADTPEAIAALLDAAAGCDLVVSSGGVSVGAFDYVKQVLEDRGLTGAFWKVAIKPGKPLLHGRLDGRPYFGLPGNPVSALVTFQLFVRPVIRRLSGHLEPGPFRVKARLDAEAPAAKGRQNMVWIRLALGDEGWVASPLPRQGSHRQRSAVGAHGLVPVPPDAPLAPGSEVEVWLLRVP